MAADRLTVLSLGRDVSIGLGPNYQRTLQLGLVIVSVISALTIVVVGIIPFGRQSAGHISWVALSGGLRCRVPSGYGVGTVGCRRARTLEQRAGGTVGMQGVATKRASQWTRKN
ncbi:iron chelate uptake ABC transporter family permease subunit [Sinorhizobium medicae]|uniref:iron chelate uptake ABC transporter family permease subunit n=1 Tax=Sinorhizobium medicae TaxID=110321 RepID=UPI003C78A2DF